MRTPPLTSQYPSRYRLLKLLPPARQGHLLKPQLPASGKVSVPEPDACILDMGTSRAPALSRGTA